MTKNFQAIKKKYTKQAIIAAAVLGAFCGVAVACALLLALKLSAIEILWVYYLLAGVGAAALSIYPFYLLLRVDDIKLAKKLDGEYALNQKVQTMVEFAAEDGAMATLQREQTDEALTAAAAARPSARSLLKYLFIPVIAAGIACAGIFAPVKKTTVYVPPFTLSGAQEAALTNLISDVDGSELGEGVKAACSGALGTLLEELKETETQAEMKGRVVATAQGIDAVIGGSNSFVALYNVLKGDEYTKKLATAMLNGVVYYKYTSVSDIKSMDIVKRKSESCDGGISELLAEWVESVKETFYHPETGESPKELFGVSEIRERLSGYAQAFSRLLGGFAESYAGDPLYEALAAFALDIDIPVPSGYGADSYLTQVEKVCNGFVTPTCEDALSAQSYACIMDEYIRNELARIFGLSTADFGSNLSVAPDPVEDDEDEDGGGTSSPSGGHGKEIYGSDEMVLDPDSGELVKYSELLAAYSAKIQERIKEYEALASKENATAEEKAAAKYVQGELAKYISQYIDRLYNDSSSS